MALTRRDVVLAAGALFLSWILLVAGLPALRFLPHAFVAGSLTSFIALLGLLSYASFPQPHPYPRPDFVEPSCLAFTSPDVWSATRAGAATYRAALAPKPFAADDLLSASVDKLLDLLLRDFVASWYRNISPTTTFPNAIRAVLIAVLEIAGAKISEIDLARASVTRVLPIITNHLRLHQEAESAVKTNNPAATGEEFSTAVAAAFGTAKLHPAAAIIALDSATPQQQYLRRLVGRLLPGLLPENITSSSVVTVLVREIVACTVLLPVLQMVADPDVLNQWIEAYGRSVLNERKNVQKLRAALEQHAMPQQPRAPRLPQLNPYDGEREFQKFVRAVNRCTSLYDVHQAREHLNDQLQDYMTAVDPDVVYLRRLEYARILLDGRVQDLSRPPPTLPSRPSEPMVTAAGLRTSPVKAIDGLVLPTHQRVMRSDLRRSARSSPDLLSIAQSSASPRRSMDESTSRSILSGDDDDDDKSLDDGDPLARPSLNRGLESADDGNSLREGEPGVVAAVQAALDDIIDTEPDRDSLFSSTNLESSGFLESDHPSSDEPRPDPQPQTTEKVKPSLSSLGLLGTPMKRTVFSQGDLFGEDERTWEEDVIEEDRPAPTGDDEHEIREAAPGDLGLAELIQALTVDIGKLEAQQSIVESLTKKAELTGAAAELRILRKSRTSLEREIRRKELQRQHYIVQENDNSLYGKTHISITSIMVGTEADGREFALYVIEVTRKAAEKGTPVTWAITRRYNEFHELHRRLRHRYPAVRELDFPRRQVVLSLAKDVLKKRRVALEKYLRALLTSPRICRSLEFRAFLSQQSISPVKASSALQPTDIDRQDLVTRLYNSVTDGMEDFLGNIPVLDQLSLAGQNLISAASNPAATPSPFPSTPRTPGRAATYTDNPATAAEAQAEASALDAGAPPTPRAAFIQPIGDAFLELFKLNTSAAAAPAAWLRGRAVVVVLQQLLGGTVERRARDAARALTAPAAIARAVDTLRDALWPAAGPFRAAPPPRTDAQKRESARAAEAVLCTLVPDLAGGIVGRGPAKAAARRVFAVLNHERLLRHLVYCLVDEAVEIAFGVRLQQR